MKITTKEQYEQIIGEIQPTIEELRLIQIKTSVMQLIASSILLAAAIFTYWP
jgi:hypothetical protein